MHAVDSLTNVSEAAEASKASPSPKKRRKKRNHDSDDPSATLEDASAPTASSMELQVIDSLKLADYADEGEEEMSNSARRRRESRKSVRWTDDLEGGELSQATLAASYNRKELSYQPRTRLRIGNFSPLQKRILIGIGIVFIIALIAVLIVVFVVIKPSSSSSAPTASPISIAAPQGPQTYSRSHINR